VLVGPQAERHILAHVERRLVDVLPYGAVWIIPPLAAVLLDVNVTVPLVTAKAVEPQHFDVADVERRARPAPGAVVSPVDFQLHAFLDRVICQVMPRLWITGHLIFPPSSVTKEAIPRLQVFA